MGIHVPVSDLLAIHRGDRALLAPIARAEGQRQADTFAARGETGKRDTALRDWGEIAAWIEDPRAIPADPARLYAAARRTRAAVERHWRTEADQTAAHPHARHWLGLLSIERQMQLAWPQVRSA